MRQDAAVNAGNALCSLAEILAETIPGTGGSGSNVTQVVASQIGGLLKSQNPPLKPPS